MSASDQQRKWLFRKKRSPAFLARPLHVSHGVDMTDHVEMNRRNWDERAAIHHVIEATELGDISGKRVQHLQCHIGRDTSCLVRRGLVMPGLVPGIRVFTARHKEDVDGRANGERKRRRPSDGYARP
jgi:hypothetical protein